MHTIFFFLISILLNKPFLRRRICIDNIIDGDRPGEKLKTDYDNDNDYR